MEKIDLNSINESEQPAPEAFSPETDPVNRIEELLMALQLAAESFSQRITLLEVFVMRLAEKDPELGPRVKALKEKANEKTE